MYQQNCDFIDNSLHVARFVSSDRTDKACRQRVL